MASRKRRTTTKSKGGKTRAARRKKIVKRAVAKRTRRSATKGTAKTHRGRALKRQARQQRRGITPMVEERVIDVVDEPLPGVLRVTEIEEMEVRVPGIEEEE